MPFRARLPPCSLFRANRALSDRRAASSALGFSAACPLHRQREGSWPQPAPRRPPTQGSQPELSLQDNLLKFAPPSLPSGHRATIELRLPAKSAIAAAFAILSQRV